MSHALKRFREHFPNASSLEMLDAVKSANLIDKEDIKYFPVKVNDEENVKFKLSNDGFGLFIIGDNNYVITYIRLSHPPKFPNPPERPEPSEKNRIKLEITKEELEAIRNKFRPKDWYTSGTCDFIKGRVGKYSGISFVLRSDGCVDINFIRNRSSYSKYTNPELIQYRDQVLDILYALQKKRWRAY